MSAICADCGELVAPCDEEIAVLCASCSATRFIKLFEEFRWLQARLAFLEPSFGYEDDDTCFACGADLVDDEEPEE